MGGRLPRDIATARNLVRATTGDLAAGDRVVIAVSGGADSLALALATAFVAKREAWDAAAVVVDHGLQPGSADIARTAAERAGEIGLDPVDIVTADIDPASTSGPEGAAREARYAALTNAAVRLGATAVLLGHTLDDQAETVLMGLARGSGVRAIAGMPARDGLWRRPFLAMSRTQSRAVCTAGGVRWWDDPHNDDRSYTRVRVRMDALPAVEAALGPGVREALARTAAQAHADADYLDGVAAQEHERAADGGDLYVGVLEQLPPPVRTRVIRRHAIAAGCPPADLSALHVGEIDRLVIDWHGQVRVELPGKVTVVRCGATLRFAHA